MDLIGQNNLKNKLNNLYNTNKFPQVFAIIGKSGQGKTKMVNFIINLLSINKVYEINSIDDIRNAIMAIPNLTENAILHITSFENLNFRAKETLLKLCEDIPNHLYIAIEVTDTYAFEDRYYNRSYIFNLEPYSRDEIIDIVKLFKNNINDDELNKLLFMSSSPKDMENIINFGIENTFDFIDKILKNITKAQPYNSMKIYNNLSAKLGDNKMPMNLFFSLLKNVSFRQFLKTNNDELFKLFLSSNSCYELFISNPNINKRALFDNFILSLSSRGEIS